MNKDFDIGRAPVPPLRAEPRASQRPTQDGHIRGVASSSGGLIRATLGAAVAAGAILTLFWLPAEYGVDATGLGRVMGLTQMGEIKQQLYAEAEADAAATVQPVSVALRSTTTIATDQHVLERLAGIEAQIAAVAAVVGTAPASLAPTAAPQSNVAVPDVVAVAPEQTTPAGPVATAWRDEVSYTLEPSEGVEVKLVMQEGAVAAFEWTANGAVVNYDTHGDGGGQGTLSYEQGRGVADQAGELVAAFTGNHGWFWRNRTDAPVVVTLRTRGDYSEMKLP